MAQKGQLVDAERARFDFSHSAPVTEDELAAIEAEVNAVIRQNVPAETKLMAPKRLSRPAPSPCSARNTATRSAS